MSGDFGNAEVLHWLSALGKFHPVRAEGGGVNVQIVLSFFPMLLCLQLIEETRVGSAEIILSMVALKKNLSKGSGPHCARPCTNAL